MDVPQPEIAVEAEIEIDKTTKKADESEAYDKV